MRKLIVFNMITIDGYFAGPNGEIDWHNTDEEFQNFELEVVDSYGTLIFGKKTYDLMAGFWPTPEAIENDPIIAQMMNSIPKIVYSKRLKVCNEGPIWKNVTLLHEIKSDEILKLKNQHGKLIAIFGSGTIVQQFANLNLIDEYWLMVNPILLGTGKKLFDNVNSQSLSLIKTRKFRNGNVLVSYKVNKK